MPNFELPPDFPARLRALRVARHLSESELADLSGLTYKTVRALETGKRPRVMERTGHALAAALEVELDELLGEEATARDDDTPGPPVSWRRVAIGVAAGVALIVLGLGAVFLHGRGRAEWTLEPHRLTMRDAVFGLKLWEHRSEEQLRFVAPSPWDAGHMLVGTGSRTRAGGRLHCLVRANGDTLWSVGPDVDAVLQAFGHEIVGAAGFAATAASPADIDGDGEPEVVARFVHGLYYPGVLARIDREGRLLAQYANRGHFYGHHVEDVDGDGRDEVLAWGTNNAPDYQGPTVVLLDADCWAGASSDELCPTVNAVNDSAAVRVVVPAFPGPYMDLLGTLRMQAEALQVYRDPQGRVRFNVAVSAGRLAFNVTLDEHLNPVDAIAADGSLAYMRANWPDSLCVGTGPADESWLDDWLAGHRRFAAGELEVAGR